MNNKDIKVGFIGLGYAGFPMATLFALKFKVVGFDLSKRRIAELNSGVDHCGDVSTKEIKQMLDNGALLTTNIHDLQDCNVFVVTVPTPVDKNNKPDTSYISAASCEVGTVLKKGDIVIYESTVYPGATEEVCVPMLEKISGLKFNEDFFVGYSPERINPGDKIHTPANVVKVTSGSTPEAAKKINDIYSEVLGKELTHPVSSIKVAEACKIVENAQRDVNIAFVNETAKLLNSMGIDTNEVVDAMNTKWNALDFRPGFVGGHCIGVDPYYLIDLAKKKGIETKLISTARRVNNSMAEFVANKVASSLKERLGDKIGDARILILGFSFKENCPDIRNSKIFDVYKALLQHTRHVTIYDPEVDVELVRNMYGIGIATIPRQIIKKKYDAVVMCVPHRAFKNLDIKELCKEGGFVYDTRGFYPSADYKDLEIERL